MALFSALTAGCWHLVAVLTARLPFSKFWQPDKVLRSLNYSKVKVVSFEDINKYPAEDLYRYTAGRWVFNEEAEFARRYVKFNLGGLIEVSVNALGEPTFVATLRKCQRKISTRPSGYGWTTVES